MARARHSLPCTQYDFSSFLDDESLSWVAIDSRAEVLSFSAVVPRLLPSMVSWLGGLGFGLREGLKRCLRGMGIPRLGQQEPFFICLDVVVDAKKHGGVHRTTSAHRAAAWLTRSAPALRWSKAKRLVPPSARAMQI
jgi:hypothetical protein